MPLFDSLLHSLKKRFPRSSHAVEKQEKRGLGLPGGRGVPFIEPKSLNDVTQSAMRKTSVRRR